MSSRVKQRLVRFSSKYVIILHGESNTLLHAARKTWFRTTSNDVGLMTMGNCAPLRGVRHSAEHTLATALSQALVEFPMARWFMRFEEGSYVYSRELLRQLEGLRADYVGYPMVLSGVVYGDAGAGYALSRRAAEAVAHGCTREDIGVGECMVLRGWDLYDLIGLHPHHPYQMLFWDKRGHPMDHIHRMEPLQGYVNPLSYHHMSAEEIISMHDDVYTYGMLAQRSRIPRIIHQYWEGQSSEMLMQKCRDKHPGWVHRVWNNAEIRRHFPSLQRDGTLTRDGKTGQLLNQDLYRGELNLLSDIMRYEVLMWYGGVYVDGDMECWWPTDYLLEQRELDQAQAFVFLEKDGGGLSVIGMHAFSPFSVVLISELQRMDGSEPPWKSAGYLTKMIHLFDTYKKGSYLEVKVFPNHHSDVHEQYKELLQNGSTFSLYKESHGGERLRSPNWRLPWNDTLRAYADAHRIGLSTLALPRPRWVVATVDVRVGMCNRIMNILSSLAFAMATGRALLFDWPVNEQLGHSDFLDLFQQPAIAYSYSAALVQFGWTDADARVNSVTMDHTHHDFLRALRFSDLDSKYPQSVVFINRYEWWAAPLMLNPLYATDIFLGASHGRVFSVLFRFLFSPKESVGNSSGCDWLIQRRAMWETAPLTAFVACGKQHGMDGGSVLVSDADAGGVEASGCRTGLECDVNAVRQLYLYSQCRHAVLTHTSSLGACIVGLGEIADVYTVKPNGECLSRPNAIWDAGTLDGHPQAVMEVISAPPAHDPRLAFMVLMVSSSDKAVRDLQTALQLLHDNFNRHHHYPVVLFVDDPVRWQYLQFLVSSRVYVVGVHASEWAVPAFTGAYPDLFRLRNHPDHPGFSVGYRQMSRWAAGFMLGHPALARFEYVLKFDSDTFASAPWTGDPLLAMHKRRAKMGFWISYSDIDDVTDGLWRAFVGFVKARKLSLKQPGLLMDSTGRYRNTNLYGCFVGARTAAFRTEAYAELFRHFDQLGGFFKHRWDEQKIFAFYVGLYAEPNEVEFFDYVFLTHQGFTAASQLRLDIVSDAVIQRTFS